METANKKNICIRTDRELYEKFRYVSQYHYRSPNKQLVHLMKLFVAGHEQVHGKIDLSSSPPHPSFASQMPPSPQGEGFRADDIRPYGEKQSYSIVTK